jgi:hypothetical protein
MWTAQSDDEKAVLGIYDTIQSTSVLQCHASCRACVRVRCVGACAQANHPTVWDLQANKLLLSTEGAHKHNDQIRSLLFLGNTLLTGTCVRVCVCACVRVCVCVCVCACACAELTI